MIRDGAAQDIVRDPQWLPHAFSADGSSVSFVRVTRELHRSLPFADEQQLRDQPDWAIVPVDAIVDDLATIDLAPIHFVFHTAFCCSTLLVNALAAAGPVVGIKEPAILVGLMQRLECGEDPNRRLKLAMQLLARRFEGVDALVVKPTCFANPLIRNCSRPYQTLAGYCSIPASAPFSIRSPSGASLAGNGDAKVYASVMKHAPLDLGYTPVQTWEQTDLQIVGLGWLMRRNHFNRIAARYGPARVMQLEDAELTRTPARTLARVTEYFRLPAGASAISSSCGWAGFRASQQEGHRLRPDRAGHRAEEFGYAPRRRGRARRRMGRGHRRAARNWSHGGSARHASRWLNSGRVGFIQKYDRQVFDPL